MAILSSQERSPAVRSMYSHVSLVLLCHRGDLYTCFSFQVKVYMKTACKLKSKVKSKVAEGFLAFSDLCLLV